ncbi:glutamate 5-kinase (plasmid) [Verrucomicrobiaceae bacterium 227]
MSQKEKTIVVKIGSSLLVDDLSGKLRMDFLYHLMNDVAYYKERGDKIVLVSSGSVALGRRFSSIDAGVDLTLAQKQAAAAHGQPALMAAYQQFANEHNLRTAQILITLHDFEDRKRFLNAEDALEELLKQGSVPIVNENDTVATKHLRVGDNDRLSAKVVQLVEAHELVILTDVNGLWDGDGKIIEHVETLDDSVFAMAGGASGSGTGGMRTKLMAAEIASLSGCRTHITSGHNITPIRDAIEGTGLHTVIESKTTPENARHLWIATSLDVKGRLEISKDVLLTLGEGVALLPSQIMRTEGEFGRGDVVELVCGEVECGRGIVAFNANEVKALMGRENPDVLAVLGYKTRPEIIHKNDLALL